ncbi:helix-turn-helix domain-containing protein [Streptomyces sp. NPDC017979]|uniref:helix-turn-helix domain-containing protein n=1 Tax=Streptomyces sp. NPDC017979 TaxID=3365024 RepID=UPI003788BC3A
MSTDFQRARSALGARLRELRIEAGHDGKRIAECLGWQRSKVSRLENGKQTPSPVDLRAWAAAVGRSDLADDLVHQVASLETRYRSWRRQLAGGHRARQELGIQVTNGTDFTRSLEVARVPGLLQTADYARNVFTVNAEFRGTIKDTEEAVRARLRRQQALYEPGKRFHFLVWEGALHVLTCTKPVMAAQLDRLTSLIGLDTMSLGILPLGAELRRAPTHGFCIYDRRLVIVETTGTELWLDDEESIRTYERAWEWFADCAVYGSQAHRLIIRARGCLQGS